MIHPKLATLCSARYSIGFCWFPHTIRQIPFGKKSDLHRFATSLDEILYLPLDPKKPWKKMEKMKGFEAWHSFFLFAHVCSLSAKGDKSQRRVFKTFRKAVHKSLVRLFCVVVGKELLTGSKVCEDPSFPCIYLICVSYLYTQRRGYDILTVFP